VLFELPWGNANAYGTLILLGGVLSLPGIIWDTRSRGLAKGQLASFIIDFYLVLIVGAAVGGRFLHVVTNPGPYLAEPIRIVSPEGSGFVFFGSLLAIVAGWGWLTRRYAIRFGALCDIGLTWMGLGHAFGRLGCFMAGCCWGAPTDLAWGLRFPPNAVVTLVHGAPLEGDHTVPLHPVQLYESLGLAILFIVLLGIRLRRGVEPEFRQSSRYALGYGVIRVLTEMVRGDASRGYVVAWMWPSLSRWLSLPLEHSPGLSISQAIAFGMIAVGVFGLRRTRPGGRT